VDWDGGSSVGGKKQSRRHFVIGPHHEHRQHRQQWKWWKWWEERQATFDRGARAAGGDCSCRRGREEGEGEKRERHSVFARASCLTGSDTGCGGRTGEERGWDMHG